MVSPDKTTPQATQARTGWRSLAGKAALVTGGPQGIGRAIARRVNPDGTGETPSPRDATPPQTSAPTCTTPNGKGDHRSGRSASASAAPDRPVGGKSRCRPTRATPTSFTPLNSHAAPAVPVPAQLSRTSARNHSETMRAEHDHHQRIQTTALTTRRLDGHACPGDRRTLVGANRRLRYSPYRAAVQHLAHRRMHLRCPVADVSIAGGEGRYPMATTTPSAALVPVALVFTNTERLALAGVLAAYSGLTRQGIVVTERPAGRKPWSRGRRARPGPARLTGQAFILCFACISLMWSAASCRMMTG